MGDSERLKLGREAALRHGRNEGQLSATCALKLAVPERRTYRQ